MLIEKTIAENDVVSIKLINGDELIARFENETADTITINKPMVVTLGPQGLGMIPWVFLGKKDSLVLQKSHIFVTIPSKKEAADQYVQNTTGIALR